MLKPIPYCRKMLQIRTFEIINSDTTGDLIIFPFYLSNLLKFKIDIILYLFAPSMYHKCNGILHFSLEESYYSVYNIYMLIYIWTSLQDIPKQIKVHLNTLEWCFYPKTTTRWGLVDFIIKQIFHYSV